MPCKSKKDDTAKENALWSAQCTHALLVLLDEHVRKNHGKSSTNKDFKVMAEKLLDTCYKRYLYTQVKSKYHRMGNVYNAWKKLINHTGFGWNFETNMPTYLDDVWKDYCKANPGASSFKYVGLLDLDMNQNVFEKVNATGGLAYTSANQPCDLEEEEEMEDRFLNSGFPQYEGEDEAFQEYVRGQHSGDKCAGPSTGRGRGKKKMTPESESISAAMMEVTSALKARASQHTVNQEDEFSLATCQRIIDSMSIPLATYVKAMKYLMDNKEWCGIFGRMSEEYRWSWIASLE